MHTGCHPQGPKLTSYTASTSTTGRRAHGPDPTPRGNIDMHGRGRRNFPRRGGCLPRPATDSHDNVNAGRGPPVARHLGS